jgi:hypothetical protein
MSTLKSVGNKLFKTELDSQKVELSLQQIELAVFADAKTQLDKAKSNHKEFLSLFDEMTKVKMNFIKKGSDLSQANERIISELESDKIDFSKRVDELLGSGSADKTPQVKEYNSSIKEIDNVLKYMKSLINESK